MASAHFCAATLPFCTTGPGTLPLDRTGALICNALPGECSLHFEAMRLRSPAITVASVIGRDCFGAEGFAGLRHALGRCR